MNKERYEATVYSVDGQLVASWNNNLYRVGKVFERKKSGIQATDHGGLILRNGKVYTATKDHDGISRSQAVLYLGEHDTTGRFGRFSETGDFKSLSKYVGIRGCSRSRPLYPLSEIDPNAEARCSVCGHKTSIEDDGIKYGEVMEEHINERHVSDGQLTSGALEEMYNIV